MDFYCKDFVLDFVSGRQLKAMCVVGITTTPCVVPLWYTNDSVHTAILVEEEEEDVMSRVALRR